MPRVFPGIPSRGAITKSWRKSRKVAEERGEAAQYAATSGAATASHPAPDGVNFSPRADRVRSAASERAHCVRVRGENALDSGEFRGAAAGECRRGAA